jgi:hypothetical protein
VFGNTYGFVEGTNTNIEALQIVDMLPLKKNQIDKRPRIRRFLEEFKLGACYNKTRGWHRLHHYSN